ncbi:MAG TPA: preprotein translocase subunit YajC [Burkholderiaceae bacterium]
MAQGFDTNFLITIGVMMAAMYFVMIRPQMKKQKELKAIIDAVAKGSEIVTTSGILGKVVKVKDDYLTVEVAAGVEIIMQRNAVVNVLQTGTIKSI